MGFDTDILLLNKMTKKYLNEWHSEHPYFLQVKIYGTKCLQSGSADTIGVNRVMALV